MKKLFTLLFASIILLMISPNEAFAADMNVECPKTGGGCTISGSNPLFSQALDGFWYPGKILTKTINLKNIGGDIRQMGLKATETSEPSILKDVMSVSIVNSSATVIWAGSLTDFYNLSSIVMGTFNPGADQDFDFSASMDANANNDYQGLATVFDLRLGFWGDAITLNNNNVGGPGDGLSDGLGCGSNGCNSSTNTSQGQTLGVSTGPTQEFEQGVLGAKTNTIEEQNVIPTPTPKISEEVLGNDTVPTNWSWSNFLKILVVFFILFFIIFWILKKRKKS